MLGVLFQGQGYISKYGKYGCAKMKNSYKIAKKIEMIHTMYGGNAFRVHVRVICIYLKKGNLIWLDKKVKKNKIRMIIPARVHSMGYWDNGHMTNCQKWSKTKVVALNCGFSESVGIMF
jgi:hypothetical protein